MSRSRGGVLHCRHRCGKTITARSGHWPPDQLAAMRPVIAVIRAKRSILLAQFRYTDEADLSKFFWTMFSI